MQSKLSENFGK